MCGLGQCSNRTLWKSWFSRVKRTGSKCCRHSRISSLTARARATSAGADQRSGECRRGALDDAQGLHRVEVLGRVDAGDGGADVPLERHQALGLEPADGLADRHHADAQVLGDLAPSTSR